jgi:hypothetical protein
MSFLLKSLLIFSLILSSCNIYYSPDYSSDGSVNWVKKYKFKRIQFKKKNTIGPGCEVYMLIKPDTITKQGIFESFNFYEFDTVRIYVKQNDEFSNKLFLSKLLKGYLFINENSPKSDFNGWKGYNIFINRIEEDLISFRPYTRQEKKRKILKKTFKISANFKNAPFIGPDVFQFYLSNLNYRLIQDDIDLNTFLENATLDWFYIKGAEL